MTLIIFFNFETTEQNVKMLQQFSLLCGVGQIHALLLKKV